MKRIALIGNPNVGKTMLFNRLTGSKQHVGNWPGVTVERKEGSAVLPDGSKLHVTDLPGVYSLTPYSIEEKVSRSFVMMEQPDVIVDIVDATNLERNLYLTTQLLDLGRPVVVALNMMDELRASGSTLDVELLSERIGVPVVPVVALTGEGLPELLATIQAQESVDEFETPQLPADLVIEIPPEEELTRLTEARYERIGRVMPGVIVQSEADRSMRSKSDKLDRAITHPLAAVPIFLAVVFLIFHLTFGENLFFLGSILGEGFAMPGPGVWLQGLMEEGVAWLAGAVQPLFVPGSWAESLIITGVIPGVGAVLSFVPQILLLFLFLQVLEDSGYMARAAFIMDRFMRRFGLTGKSFVPMLMGFGCSVPAVMAARTMETENDRKLTMLLVPFMSCGAKAPIFIVLTSAFFAQYADIVVFGLYLGGILMAVATGLIFKKFVFKSEAAPFFIELPSYRLPRLQPVAIAVGEKLKDYVVRAGTIIFAMSVVIWFFQSYDMQLQPVDVTESMLASFGSAIAPIFSPLGFGEWRPAISLITGFAAKEAVIGTMGILYGVGEEGALEGGLLGHEVLAADFTGLSALAFLVFALLYIPCMATVATVQKEAGTKWMWVVIGWTTGIAYVMALLVYQVGSLLGFS